MSQGEEAFTHALGRTACAQILYAQAERVQRHSNPRHGVRGGGRARPVLATTILATESVIDALSDIAGTFIETVGRHAARRTQMAGRNVSNLLDVLGALDTLAPVTNSNVRDIVKYSMFQEIPFPYHVPEVVPVLPVTRKRKREVYVQVEGEGDGEGNGRTWVEGWMPELPSAHTYVATPVWVEKKVVKKDAAVVDRQRRRVEKSLARLKEKKGSGRVGSADMMDTTDLAAEGNPFMAMPKLGNGKVFEDEHVEARDIIEGGEECIEEGDVDSNITGLMDVPKGVAHEQKRQRVERILAESGAGTTVVSGKPDPI